MLSWGSKYLLALSFAALVGAIAFGLVTGGELIGVISAGYKGGVGSHLGYVVMLFLSLVLFCLAVTDIVTRGGDSEVLAEQAHLASIPALPTLSPVMWPPITAFGVACTIIGLAMSTPFLIVGLLVLVIMGLEWLLTAWSDRASGDAEANAVIRSRILGPIEVPLLGLLTFGVAALAMSRVFLTLSATGAVIAGSIAALIVFGLAALFAKKDVPRSALSLVMVLGALAIIGGGIVGETRGQREFHDEEHGSETEHSTDTESGEGEGE